MGARDFVARFVSTTKLTDFDGAAAPRVTLLSGAAGTAFVFAELFRRGYVPERTVRGWLGQMRLLAKDARGAFLSRARGDVSAPERFKIGPASGRPGMAVAVAEVGHALADPRLFDAGVRDFARAWERAVASGHLSAELYGGSGGYHLLAVRMLRLHDELSPTSRPGRARVVLEAIAGDARTHLLDALRAPLKRRPYPHLGAAHGLAGELFAALASEGPVPAHVEARLDELTRLATTEGELIAWPSTVGTPVPPKMWSSICNGVPGQLLLYSVAARRFGDASHRAMALRCARTTFALGAKVGTICCGFGGQVVALDTFSRATDDPWARRAARTRLRDAIALYAEPRQRRAFRATADNSPALLQGAGGIALLAARALARQPLDYWFS